MSQLGEGDLVPENALGWGLQRVRRSQAWLLGTGPWSLQLCGGSGWLRCSRRSLGDPVDSGPGGACPRREAPRGGPRGLRLSAPGVYVLRLPASRGDVRNAGSGGAHVVPSLRWPHNQLPRSTPVTLRRALQRHQLDSCARWVPGPLSSGCDSLNLEMGPVPAS